MYQNPLVVSLTATDFIDKGRICVLVLLYRLTYRYKLILTKCNETINQYSSCYILNIKFIAVIYYNWNWGVVCKIYYIEWIIYKWITVEKRWLRYHHHCQWQIAVSTKCCWKRSLRQKPTVFLFGRWRASSSR